MSGERFTRDGFLAPKDVFDAAGGWEFIDELADGVFNRAIASSDIVVLSQQDVLWLIDGYTRVRLGEKFDL
jgi:hypothetical protein